MNNREAVIMQARVKEPRVLGYKETRDNIDHWLTSVKSYWKRDDRARHFMNPAVTWNPTGDNHGLVAEPAESKLKRTSADLKEDLFDFL